MASVLDLLAQGMPSEESYLSDNPFFMGGRGLSQIQTQPTTNVEAWWMPAVQGGLSGLLQGYGRAGARQAQFADTKEMPFIKSQLADESALTSNPSLAAYLSESAPESWSPKQAKADVMTSLLLAQNQQEQQAEKAKLAAQLKAKIDEATNQDIIKAEAQKAQAIESAKLGAQEPSKTALKVKDEEDAARKEITALPSVATYLTMGSAIKKIESMADLDTKTSDIPFTYALVQSQDGGVVKEGEFAKVQGSSPILEKYKNLLNGALNGTSELTPTIKRQMVAEMKQQHASVYDQARIDADPRLQIAKRRGAEEQNVLPLPTKEAKGYSKADAIKDGYSAAEIADLTAKGYID